MMSSRRFTINSEMLARLSVILFFSYNLWRVAFQRVFGSGNLSTALLIIFLYSPLLLAVCLDSEKYIKKDFIALYLLILLFFGITYLIHPEYEYYYKRESYGVWDHVLVPYRGIYAYLFIRLEDDSEKLKHDLKIAGWIMLIYFAFVFSNSMRRGSWNGITSGTVSSNFEYSISFGYTVLPFALLFLHSAFTEKKITDIVPAVLDLVFLFLGGSRGPILFIGVFVIIYLWNTLQKSRYKILLLLLIGVVVVFIYNIYNYAVQFLTLRLSRAGLGSRFLSMLQSGEIVNDSGRSRIWRAAIEMIKTHPLGYGAMGSRHIISKYIYVGYPHSMILEMLIDFGVIFGGLILIAIVVNSFKTLFFERDNAWHALFLIYFSASCSLLLSLTFWSVPTIWTCFAIFVNKKEEMTRVAELA